MEKVVVRVDDVVSVNGFSPSSMTLPLLNDEHPRNNWDIFDTFNKFQLFKKPTFTLKLGI